MKAGFIGMKFLPYIISFILYWIKSFQNSTKYFKFANATIKWLTNCLKLMKQNRKYIGIDEIPTRLYAGKIEDFMSKSEAMRYVNELFNREANLIDRKYEQK